MSALVCLNTVGSAIARCLSLLPVVLVLLLVATDWYSFVIDYTILHYADRDYPAITAFLCIIFTLLLILTLWSYYRTINTSSSVRDNPPPPDYYTRYRIAHPNEPVRICARCRGQPKPLRAHHCSICGECILKMDHHCPWVANCIGFKNYKYFVLFLFYATLSTYLYQLAGITLVIAVFTSSELNASLVSLLAAIITGSFAFALTFFTLFHVSLVLSGQTTIEVHAARSGRTTVANGDHHSTTDTGSGSGGSGGSGAGWKENWQAVFGSEWQGWLLPIDTVRMSGYEFDFGSEGEGEGEEVEDVERGLMRQPVSSDGSSGSSGGGDSAMDAVLIDGGDEASGGGVKRAGGRMSSVLASLTPGSGKSHDMMAVSQRDVESDDD